MKSFFSQFENILRYLMQELEPNGSFEKQQMTLYLTLNLNLFSGETADTHKGKKTLEKYITKSQGKIKVVICDVFCEKCNQE